MCCESSFAKTKPAKVPEPMPAIADADEEMQESTPALLDAVVQASKERLAKRKLAVQQAQAKAV
jgi:hypothetical protein